MSNSGLPRPHGLPSKFMYDELHFQTTLGEGQYGSVWRCIDRRTGEVLACKQMNKKKHPKSVDRETNCFVRVQTHENVVTLKQLYEDEENIYFLMELCNGGDLLPVICKSGGLSEEVSSAIFWQLVEAVQHCHTRGVIHRDIKPENVLLNKPGPDGIPQVKLADFGLATWLKPGKLAQGWVGSPPYEAPEVIDLKPYDYSADIWSLGVVLYGMLSANWPSFLQGRKFNRKIDFQAPIWQPVSVEAKSLIIRMLASNPAERPTCSEILRDPWFALLLPEKFISLSMEEEDEASYSHSHSAALPLDHLAGVVLPPPQVTPYERALPPRILPAQPVLPPAPRTPEPRDVPRSSTKEHAREKGPKVPRADGSFGSWLDEELCGPEKGAPRILKMVVEDGALHGSTGNTWKTLTMSESNSSKMMITPPAAPCSDSSTTSSPASPESKPVLPGAYSTAKASDPGKNSFTRALGKRLLQMVTDTLNVNPMCTRLNPSDSHAFGDGSGPVPGTRAPGCLHQEIRRPSTASGRRTQDIRAI